MVEAMRTLDLLGCFQQRHDNALVELRSPWKAPRGRWFLRFLLGFFPVFSTWSILDPSNTDPRLWDYGWLAILFLMLLPFPLCLGAARTLRHPQVAQDLWLTAMTPREVMFGLWYWPYAIQFLMTISAVASALLHVALYEEPLQLLVFLSPCLVPFIVIPILLRHGLDNGRGPLLVMGGVIGELLATCIGGYILMSAIGFVLEPVRHALDVSSDAAEVLRVVLVMGLLALAKGNLLISRGARRYFHSVETFELVEGPLVTVSLAAGSIRRAVPIVVTLGVTCITWVAAAGAVLSLRLGFSGPSQGGVFAILSESGVPYFPMGLSSALCGLIAGAWSLSRSAGQGSFPVMSRFPSMDAARLMAPLVVTALIPTIVSGVITIAVAEDDAFGKGLVLIVAAVISVLSFMTLLGVAITFVPRTGRGKRLIMAAVVAVAFTVVLAKLLIGSQSEEGFFFRPIDAPTFTLALIFTTIGWLIVHGYQSFLERMYRDGVYPCG